MALKACGRCLEEKALSDFRADPRYRDGVASWCRQCHRVRNSTWAKENRDRLTVKSANWRASNIGKAREVNRNFKERNKGRLAAEHADWAKRNKDKRRETWAKRRAVLRAAMPQWADRAAIRAIYRRAVDIENQTGVRMHVDHIVPLQHELVCGLHCEANLQILPGHINESKKNNWTSEALV